MRRETYKKKTLPKLKAIAQKYFNKWIRERDLDHSGYFECISCGKWEPARKMNAGHFIHASRCDALRFNSDNVHGQCIDCNLGGHGEQYRYGLRLKEKIGDHAFKTLLEAEAFWKRNTKKWTKDEIIDIIFKYKNGTSYD